MAHDRRVHQDVERFRGQRAEGRQGEPEDVSIVR